MTSSSLRSAHGRAFQQSLVSVAAVALVACATGAQSNGFDASDLGVVLSGDGGTTSTKSSSSRGGPIIVGTGPGSSSSAGAVTKASSSSTESLDAGDCISGETMCPDGCTDTSSDPNNCGTCEKTCSSSTCTNGQCVSGSTGFDAGDDDSFDAGGGGGGSDSCAHSPCAMGAKLMDGCDDDSDGLVSSICEGDQPECCSHTWGESCVEEAVENCQIPGFGDLCADPGC